MNLPSRLLLFSVAGVSLFFAGCNSLDLSVHPCDACRPCEVCEAVVDGAAVCSTAPSQTRRCGEDGHIHSFDSCEKDEGIDVECPAASTCIEETSGEAICECLHHWTGDSCDVCPDNWDENADCNECINHWSGDDCDICLDNWDADAACNACSNHWTGENCDTCPGNWDSDAGCAVCRNRWTGEDCDTCPGNWDAEADCAACRNRWTGDDCDTCLDNWDAEADCAACRNQWTGADCDICPEGRDASLDCDPCLGNRDPATDCEDCLAHWIDDGDDCATCPGNWDSDAGCDECRTHWQDNDDDCGTCPGNWDGDADCNECRTHWQDNDDNCGTCPGNWNREEDCNACLPGWSGDDCETQEACVVYVSVDMPNDGADGAWWTRAFSTVNQGIAQALTRIAEGGTSGTCDVWVREGRYFVYETARTDTISLAPGIRLYGGFVGDETARDDRDPSANETVLDGHSFDGSTEQVYHVVTGSDDARIDGFTITGGRADDDTVDGGTVGGGMLNDNRTPEIINCTFRNNYAVAGGGLLNYETGEVRIEGCLFIENEGSHYGGGLRNFNAASRIVSSRFIENSANTGAGVDNSGSVTVMEQVVFESNTADSSGGGIYNTLGGLEISNAVFLSNQARGEGGAIAVHSGLEAVTNVTFFGNSATYDGGGAVSLTWDSTPDITNCILYGNYPDDLALHNSAAPSVTYSLVEDGYTGDGNIAGDPLFADPENGDLHLSPGSPAIDAGNAAVAPLTDLNGTARYDDPYTQDTGYGTAPLPDLGAFELSD